MQRRWHSHGSGFKCEGATREKLEMAKRWRPAPTVEETFLWGAIRGRRLREFKFRRQHVIAGFIVDFYCPIAQLVLEVDGPYQNCRHL